MSLTNEPAERIVLGTAIKDRTLAYEISSFSSELFSVPEYRQVHAKLVQNIKEFGITSQEYLLTGGIHPTVIRALVENGSDVSIARNMLPVLSNLASLRILRSSCNHILWDIDNNSKKSSSELLTKLVEASSALNIGATHTTKTYEELIEIVKKNPQPDKHLTPWPNLNMVLEGGFEVGSYIMVFAEANVGKTLLLCQFSGFLANRGHKVVFFSLEQPYMAIGRRIFAQYEETLGEKSRNIKIITNCDTIEEITARMAVEAAGNPKTVFCIDHIQNIRSSHLQTEGTAFIERISKDITRTIRRTNCTTFVVSEVNRREGDGLNRTRGSGALEHDFDIGIFMDMALTENQVKVKIGKNRNGPKGHVFLTLDRKTLRFSDA